MKIESISQGIGNTPLLRLHNIEKKLNLKDALYGKLEGMNPSGSVKDRAALYMIAEAEQQGVLKKGGSIIEPTSGNTGIGLAQLAAERGYKAIFVMPDTMSKERRAMLTAYGAEIVLTPGSGGMQASVDKALEMVEEKEGAVYLGQFENKANPKAHFETTGPEIWEDLYGNIDVFMAGVGTGGTLTGVGEFLKIKKPEIKALAIEPQASPILSGGTPGPHKIQGIGANFVPEVLNKEIMDGVLKVSNEDAVKYAKILAVEEGYFAGISSGAVLAGALNWIKENPLEEREEKVSRSIVMVFPDTGSRYLSLDVF